MTNKKFLFIGMAVLLSASLFFFGCSTDSDEPEGPETPVSSETTLSSGVADAAALVTAFATNDTVKLASGVTGVDGVVPEGKTLVVEATMPVTKALSLEVLGTLQIETGAVLDASYVTDVSGYLKGTGAVKGAGSVKLPYFAAAAAKPASVVSFVSETVTAVKIAGSYNEGTTEGGTPGGALTVAGVKALFALDGGPTELTASDLTGIDAATVPTGKTLTLSGNGNTTSTLDLSSGGKLVVGADAVLEVTISITGKADTDVKGTIKLAAEAVALAVTDVNLADATVDATAAGAATLTLGSGTRAVKAITVGAANDLTVAGPTQLTVDAITAGTGKGIKSGSVTTYATGTSAADFISLATAQDTVIISSVADSVFTVETGVAAVALNSALTFGGNAKIKTNGTGGISTTGMTGGYLELTTANLAKFASGSKITFSDAIVGTASTGLEIPAGVDVTASASGATFLNFNALTLNAGASLTAANATLAGVVTLAVEEDATLTASAATLAALTTVTGTGDAVVGVVDAAKAEAIIESTLTDLTIASTAITATDLAIPADTIRTFTGAAAPTGDVTVATGATLNVEDASLTIVAGKALSIGAEGTVALVGTGSVVLTSAATTEGVGAKITGAGTLTAGDLAITGEWVAKLDSGTAAESVTIAAVAAGQATITGSITATTASLVGGAGGLITQKAGTASNKLTLATVTIDVSANGEVVLKGADTNGASLVLASAAAIIKGAGTTGEVTNANITAIGNVAVADVTIGTNLVFTDDASVNVFETIAGAASNNDLTAKKNAVDVSLSKTTTLTYTAG